LSISGGGAASTEQNIALKLTTSGEACSITGWPHVVGHSRTQTTTAGRVTYSPAITVAHAHPRRLAVDRTRAVYVMLVGADAADLRRGGKPCPSSYRTFVVSLPGRGGALRVVETPTQAAGLVMCGTFDSTPFVPVRHVIAEQR
jgi:hypothetical protein